MRKNQRKPRIAVVLLITVALTVVGVAETWRLGNNQQWQKVADANSSGKTFNTNTLEGAIAQAKQLASEGKRSKAKKAYAKISLNYPQFAGDDFNAYVKAELMYAKRKYAEAAKIYSDFIDNYPESPLWQAALEREFQIGSAFLYGQKRTVLKIFKLHAYEEGTEIMYEIADTTGDAPIAKRAIETLAVSNEKRDAFDEAYLAWADAQNRWPTGDMGQMSLLGMARSLEKDYKGPAFDGKVLISSKSYYTEYTTRYPESAQQLQVSQTLATLEREMSEKELLIAEYYKRTASYQAADLYYQQVISRWPASAAAKAAEQKLPEVKKLLAESQLPKKKKFNWKGLFL